MVDQQEALERQRELYQEKNEHLERFLEPVAPYEFYREIFPEGSFERKGHFEDRKGLCLKYSFRPDGMEESIILAIKCQNEEAKEKVIDMLDADTRLIITGSLKAENDKPIIELTDFYFLQTYKEKILSMFLTPEEVQQFVNSDIDLESLLDDDEEE